MLARLNWSTNRAQNNSWKSLHEFGKYSKNNNSHRKSREKKMFRTTQQFFFLSRNGSLFLLCVDESRRTSSNWLHQPFNNEHFKLNRILYDGEPCFFFVLLLYLFVGCLTLARTVFVYALCVRDTERQATRWNIYVWLNEQHSFWIASVDLPSR